MKDEHKTKAQLRAELAALRQRVAELEISETERKQAEAQFRSLTEATFEGIVIHDKGRILAANQAMAGMFGYEISELIGMSALELTAPAYRDLARQHILANYEKAYESLGLRKDGTSFEIEVTGKPFPYQGQTVRVTAVRDITHRKQAMATLSLAHEQAVAANRLKGQLLATVSHELRTPLNAILGFTEMLEVGIYGPLSDKQREATRSIISSTLYLTDLVQELLDQAQLEAGKLKLSCQPFAPGQLVEQVRLRSGLQAQAKGLSLTTEVAPDVPAKLQGDPARLQQILDNLVSNAIKFTEQGQVRVRLYRVDQRYWALQVSDTGPGIPAQFRSEIFEPFYQVDSSLTRQHGGYGLGLSIVQHLTGLMGGQLSLESEVGRGSTFTVRLPLRPDLEF